MLFEKKKKKKTEAYLTREKYEDFKWREHVEYEGKAGSKDLRLATQTLLEKDHVLLARFIDLNLQLSGDLRRDPRLIIKVRYHNFEHSHTTGQSSND